MVINLADKDIIVAFTNKGAASTGLSATVDVWETDGTQVVTAQAMTEIAGGFYKYTFASYDSNKDYVIRADGSATLSDEERYQFGINNQNLDTIAKIERNQLFIDTVANTLTIYDDDKTTALKVFDLKDATGTANTTNVFQRIPQ